MSPSDRERILLVVSRVMRVPMSELNEESSSKNVKAWDSLAHMQLIAVLEQEFDIRFTMNDITNAKNLGELMEAMCKSHSSSS